MLNDEGWRRAVVGWNGLSPARLGIQEGHWRAGGGASPDPRTVPDEALLTTEARRGRGAGRPGGA